MEHDQDMDDDDDIEDDEEDGPEDPPDEPEDEMEGSEEPEYTITIEYDEFITRFDLDEILRSIDRIIEIEVFDYFDPEFRFLRRRYPYSAPYWENAEPEFSYLGIRSISSGSITLAVFASGAVVGYVARRFKKGVDKSLLAEELERSGRLTGNVFGSALTRINDWAEKYVPKQRELGGRVTKIAVKRKRKSGESDKDK
jgi:hypothetical protein